MFVLTKTPNLLIYYWHRLLKHSVCYFLKAFKDQLDSTAGAGVFNSTMRYVTHSIDPVGVVYSILGIVYISTKHNTNLFCTHGKECNLTRTMLSNLPSIESLCSQEVMNLLVINYCQCTAFLPAHHEGVHPCSPSYLLPITGITHRQDACCTMLWSTMDYKGRNFYT